MTGEVCIDANVAVKWYVPEDWEEQAASLLDVCHGDEVMVIVPDIFFSEVGSSVWRAVLNQIVEPQTGELAMALLKTLPVRTVEVRELLLSAWRIANRFRLATLYDAYYLALAEQHACTFWTADERLINSVGALPFVKHIKEFVPGMLEG